MNLLTTPILYGLGALAIGAGVLAGVQTVRLAGEKAQRAKAETILAEYRAQTDREIARFEVEARATEQRHSADMARIGQQHQQESKDASDKAYQRAVADVRAGRLRNVWQCPIAASVPSVKPAASGADEGADLRGESAGRIFRAVAECEAQLIGLQDVVKADRAK